MSRFDELERKTKLAREYNNFMYEKDLRLNKRLKEADNQRKSDELFRAGIDWILIHNKLLDEAVQTFTYNGEEKMLKDDIHFQRGYENGCKQMGYKIGYNGTSFVTVDDWLLTDKYFLTGYKLGLQDAEKNRNKTANKK